MERVSDPQECFVCINNTQPTEMEIVKKVVLYLHFYV